MEVALPEQTPNSVTDECPHHWMIETPNGETSTGLCKRCGTTKAFLNYSQRKILTRSVKPNAPTAVNPVTMAAPTSTTTTSARA
jgi:hypothetical protein